MLRFYKVSNSLRNDETEIFNIKRLKSMGFYTLEDIKDGLLQNTSNNQKLKPKSNDRYRFSPITIGGVNSYLKKLQLIEFMFSTSIPYVINLKYPFTYINKEKFINLYKLFPLLLLSSAFQYESNSLDSKNITALIQKIIFSKDVTHKEKKEIANRVINIYHFYSNKKNVINGLYINIISEFLNILDYNDWKDFYKEIKNIILPSKNTHRIEDRKISNFFMNIDDLEEVKDIYLYLIKSDFEVSKYIKFLLDSRNKAFLEQLYPLVKEELKKVYNDIFKTLAIIGSTLSNKYFKTTNIKIFERMLSFLEGNKEILKNIGDYKQKIKDLNSKLENLREYSDIQAGIISKNNDKIFLALNDLISYIINNPKKEISYYWYPLLIKILKFEEPKLEFALEVLSKTLFYTLKNEKWPKNKEYKSMYIDILDKYYNYEYLEETELDREFIEIQLLRIAYVLKNNFKLKNEIITKILALTKTSIFNSVKSFNFED